MSVWLVDPVCRARLTTMARTRDVTRTHVLGAATVIHPSADELLRDHGSTSPVGLFMQDWLREFKQVRGSPTGPVARYHCAHHLNSDGAAAEIAWSRTQEETSFSSATVYHEFRLTEALAATRHRTLP